MFESFLISLFGYKSRQKGELKLFDGIGSCEFKNKNENPINFESKNRIDCIIYCMYLCIVTFSLLSGTEKSKMFLNKISALAGLCSKQNAIRKIMPHRSIFAPAVSTFVRYYSFDDFDDRPKGYAKHYSQQRNPKRSFDNEDNRPRHFQRNNFQSKNFQRNDYQRGYQQNNNSSFGQMTRPNWKEIELNEIKRNFYQPHETTLNRSDEDVQKYREQHEIAAPRDTPKPILSFDELSSVPGQVLTEMKNRNFESLTPIQAQGWPIALSGQNMVGVAQTG